MPLVTTSEGSTLGAEAAAAYELLNAAFTAHFGYRLVINSGSRTYAEQVAIFTTNNTTTPTRYSNGKFVTRQWQGKTWYLKPGYATAAVPGTSNHEYPPGIAADFGSGVQTRYSAQHNWMIANAGRWGWVWTGRDFVTIEPWHWEKRVPILAGGDSKPFDPVQEDDMSAAAEAQIEAIYNMLKKDQIGYPATTQVWVESAVATANAVQRGEIYFPGAPYFAFTALANGQAAILAAIKALDPSDPASATDFVTIVQESEERIKASFDTQAASLKNAIKLDIATAIGQINDLDPVTAELVTDAVEEAFGKVYKNFPTEQ